MHAKYLSYLRIRPQDYFHVCLLKTANDTLRRKAEEASQPHHRCMEDERMESEEVRRDAYGALLSFGSDSDIEDEAMQQIGSYMDATKITNRHVNPSCKTSR